ncbi:MAG: hypothetical protein LBG59_00070 [Candidatus Peribacteria bacterium]|jgi:hypothetical protein|nr:hypothetical protein [Candidatus Peribacteria bacterium]
MKNKIMKIVLFTLLVGWGTTVFILHEGFFRNALLCVGVWYVFRFFLRGKRTDVMKWWDIAISLLEIAGIAFVIGMLNMLAVNVRVTFDFISHLFGGRTTEFVGLSRVFVVMLELEIPALIGLSLGIIHKNKKIKKS